MISANHQPQNSCSSVMKTRLKFPVKENFAVDYFTTISSKELLFRVYKSLPE